MYGIWQGRRLLNRSILNYKNGTDSMSPCEKFPENLGVAVFTSGIQRNNVCHVQ